MTAYAELHCLSNFSFLRGASHPHELVEQAHRLGYRALALTDECSLAGIVKAHQRAQELQIKLIIGTEVQLHDGPKLVLLAPNLIAYSQLCHLISHGRQAAHKGSYQLNTQDVENAVADCLCVLLADQHTSLQSVEWIKAHWTHRAWIGLSLHRAPDDAQKLAHAQALSQRSGLPLVACGDVHMHRRERRVLQDVLTAIRHNSSLQTAGQRLFANGERHLRRLSSLSRLYPAALLQESVKIAARCQFGLEQLVYRYPAHDVPAGFEANAWLRKLTEQGLRKNWPQGAPTKVLGLIEKELKLIQQLNYPHYFLTVHEIMQWAKAQGILCQGRGSAANSAVCFVLGITVVNPEKSSTLFERFISAERKEPPDIDVDFEHHRREEVFQHIYKKYGRKRAAIAATIIRYRPKSALRDVGKALGMEQSDIARISQSLAWWDKTDELPERLRSLGFDPQSRSIAMLLKLADELQGFPRHLSQHVGGFVISDQNLDQLVPIENAAMSQRTVIQWDKDDLDAVGLFKIDCLALGMLTAIHKSFDLVRGYCGRELDIPTILATEAAQGRQARQVFSMLGQAQSVGVFQVESRAQMSMLPRMKPQNLYDLTIETAIVRPGPIQGGMVHPYLNRRMGKEPIDCPAGLQEVLGRTNGIPIFQEQVMEVCVKAGGFAPGEADQVRRSMAAWGRSGHDKLERFEQRLKQGMAANGYSAEFSEQIFQQIKGFAEYGFPESHAASFAALVYVSAWLKRFEPAAFLTGLLNSQPMGFYSPSQLIQDFKRLHFVKVLPPDVLYSQWECHLDIEQNTHPKVRLGLCIIKGLSQKSGQKIAAAEPDSRTKLLVSLSVKDRAALAAADALRSLQGTRHQAHWSTQGMQGMDTDAWLPSSTEVQAELAAPTEAQDIVADYASLELSLRRHPLALLRPILQGMNVISARQLRDQRDGQQCRVAGIVTNRQRPGTAKGIIFMTLEDESGTINLIIQPDVLQRQRQEVLHAPMLVAVGRNESREGVRHLLVQRLEDHGHLLGALTTQSRDFH